MREFYFDYKKGITMTELTPCQEKGWKKGDEFVVVGFNTLVAKGEVVVLHNDDGSLIPHFYAPSQDEYYWLGVVDVEPVNSEVDELADLDKYQEAIRATLPSENGEPMTASEINRREEAIESFLKKQAEGFLSAHAKMVLAREPKEEKLDFVNHPQHYNQGKVECIDALEAATAGKTGIEAVCVANVIKYLWRYEEKNGLEDVAKAKWYLERLIKVLDRQDEDD